MSGTRYGGGEDDTRRVWRDSGREYDGSVGVIALAQTRRVVQIFEYG